MSNNQIGNKIKNFFKKKKDQVKFVQAGPGRRLNAVDQPAASTSKSKKSSDAYVPPKRNQNELCTEARNAAEAAMARVQQKQGTREFNTSLAAIKAQVKRELEEEKNEKLQLQQQQSSESTAASVEENRNLAVQGVYFTCPFISTEILPRKEWKIKIKEFLYEQLEEERALTACLIIKNCNTKEKAEQCVEILTKYIENIINHPDDEKYRKIRMGNRIFCEKIKPCEGGYEFLLGAGFVEQEIDDELFLIFSNETVDAAHLSELLEALQNSEIFHLDLDRNIQVLLPSQARKYQLPPDFYRISPEELKREQQLRSEALEQAQVLKTKAMREREELRMINRYNFALIRVRFPDGVFLQGTFNVYEKLSDIIEFVRSCLKDESFEFQLTNPTGHKYLDDDSDKSLYDLRLIPNSLLTFVYENMLYPTGNYLKEDLLMLIQPF